MLTNSIYTENQLNTERIEFYLKRITILIRKNEIRRLTKRENRITIFINNYQLKIIQSYERDSIDINMIESREKREIRKYFKCEKEDYIKRFYRVK